MIPRLACLQACILHADSAGFQIWPATFARSAAHAQYRVPAVYIYRDSASVESTRGGSLTLAPIKSKVAREYSERM